MYQSLRVAATKGNTVEFGNTKCWIYDRDGKLLGMGSLVKKLYYLDCRTITQEQVAVASGFQIGNEADLWHRRLGHLNECQLKEMVSHAEFSERSEDTKVYRDDTCIL